MGSTQVAPSARAPQGESGGPPAFTVVVPAFNAARTLEPCINSVLAQTRADFELIVVDDGSTDQTGTIAQSAHDPRVRVLHQSNRGLPAARNAGLRIAGAEITCFLDSDDLWLPSYLESVGRVLDCRPEVDFVYTDTWTFDDTTRRIRKATTAQYQRPPRPVPTDPAEVFRELLTRNFIVIPVAIRTGVIRAAGGFDESLRAAEDWEMWLRLAAAGHGVAEAPGPLGLRRMHSDQMSADPLRMFDNEIVVLEKVLSEYQLAPAERDLTARVLASVRRSRNGIVSTDRRMVAIRQLHLRLIGLRRRLDPSRGWMRRPPPAVAAAFPDLGSL